MACELKSNVWIGGWFHPQNWLPRQHPLKVCKTYFRSFIFSHCFTIRTNWVQIGPVDVQTVDLTESLKVYKKQHFIRPPLVAVAVWARNNFCYSIFKPGCLTSSCWSVVKRCSRVLRLLTTGKQVVMLQWLLFIKSQQNHQGFVGRILAHGLHVGRPWLRRKWCGQKSVDLKLNFQTCEERKPNGIQLIHVTWKWPWEKESVGISALWNR